MVRYWEARLAPRLVADRPPMQPSTRSNSQQVLTQARCQEREREEKRGEEGLCSSTFACATSGGPPVLVLGPVVAKSLWSTCSRAVPRRIDWLLRLTSQKQCAKMVPKVTSGCVRDVEADCTLLKELHVSTYAENDRCDGRPTRKTALWQTR